MNKFDFYLNSAAQGKRVHTVVWEPDDDPRAVLQLVHGMAEYIERYDEFARYLAARDIAVIGHDHLGHGQTAQSEAELGFFAEGDASEIVIRDMKTVTLEAKRRWPGVPVFILGHSMGSFFTRQYLAVCGGEVTGAVIMGTGFIPAPVAKLANSLSRKVCRFKGERHPSPLLEKLILGKSAKSFPTEGRLGWLSANRENVKRYEADPLCGFTFTAGAYRDFTKILVSVAKEEDFDGIRRSLPILVISGELDPVGGKDAVGKLAAAYRRLEFTDVTEKIFPGDRHEILNENDREAVYAYIAAWLGEKMPG